MQPRNSHAQKGFTLIEMLVVVALVGILASAAMPFIRYGEVRIKERELRASLREIRTGIDAYKKAVDDGRITRKVDATGYPPDLKTLVDGVPDLKTPDQKKIYFLRRIPQDPFAPAGGTSSGSAASAGWGLRSYASPADAPKSGDDVFDVYSLSRGTGSNGVKYRDW